MPSLESPDLENGKLDLEHVEAVATSTELTATDRKGQTKRTLKGAIGYIENLGAAAVVAFSDAAASLMTGLGAAAVITESWVNRYASEAAAAAAQAARVAAEAARDSLNTSGKVFTNAELVDGTAIAATTPGQQFSILSADLMSWAIYRNNAGSPLPIGPGSYTKAYIDGMGVEQSDEYRQVGGNDFGTIVSVILDTLGYMSIGSNSNGDAVMPTAIIEELKTAFGARNGDHYNYEWAFTDDADNVLLGSLGGQLVGAVKQSPAFDAIYSTPLNQVGIDSLFTKEMQAGSREGDHWNYDFAVADDNGYVAIGSIDGQILGAFPSSGTDTDNVMLNAADQANKAFTASVHARVVRTVQRPTAKYNIKFLFGQSLAQGDETWPAISRITYFGNLMLGGNVMSSADANVYVPFGSATLQPLVAQTVYGNIQYDAAGEAALAPGYGARGEPPVIGWVNGAKALLNERLLVENDAARTFVAVNVAKSGATIGELTKGHTEGGIEFYGKFTSALGLLATAAGAETRCVDGVMYMQGEHDYYNAAGHTSLSLTYATYYPKLVQMAANMQADAMASTGQAKPPAFLIYQTGAAYTRDADVDGVPGLHIGMAQLDFALASDKAWMVGPIYPYTDKGGHLDSNGARWFGHQIAKVYHRVVVEGRGWQPVRPIRIWRGDARTLYIGYHVPAPPLVFDTPYVVSAATNYPGKGFRIADSTGSMGPTSVTIVRDTIVKIVLPRDLTGTDADIHIWYAGQLTHNGNGNVRDSDPSVATDSYVYEPDRGMYAAANIPALVGKPYPLRNWSVAFFKSIFSELPA